MPRKRHMTIALAAAATLVPAGAGAQAADHGTCARKATSGKGSPLTASQNGRGCGPRRLDDIRIGCRPGK